MFTQYYLKLISLSLSLSLSLCLSPSISLSPPPSLSFSVRLSLSAISLFLPLYLSHSSGGAEDIETGRCAYKAGVQTLNSLDVNKKPTFFPSNVFATVMGLPDWAKKYMRDKVSLVSLGFAQVLWMRLMHPRCPVTFLIRECRFSWN